MAYIQSIDVEIGTGVDSGDGVKFCQNYCCLADKLQQQKLHNDQAHHCWWTPAPARKLSFLFYFLKKI
jgi:hypothetical protein